MVSFKALFTLCAAAVAVTAAPNPAPFAGLHNANATLARRSETFTSSTTGTYNGYFYSLYMEDSSSDTSLTVNGGSYSLTFGPNCVDVVAGVGWNPGSAQTITYSGSFSTSGNAYLAVYGWTTSPLVEYYILENYGDYNPTSGLTLKGTVTTDGATYNIYETTRTNAPSIQSSSSTFNQYWSVRQGLRTGGTVTTSNHFNAWSSLGMSMGTFNYQILATEGYESSGSSSITVSSGGTSSSTTSTTTTKATTSTTTTSASSSTASAQAEYGQCGGTGWTGATTCVSPYVCTYSNSYYSQCLPA